MPAGWQRVATRRPAGDYYPASVATYVLASFKPARVSQERILNTLRHGKVPL